MIVLSFSAVRKYIGPFGNWHVYAFAHLGYQVQARNINDLYYYHYIYINYLY